MNLALLVLIMAPQIGPSDKDAEACIKAFKDTIRNGDDDLKIEAARAALKTPHKNVIRTVGKLLKSKSQRVRIGTALALGEVDHPASVDVLAAAISANKKRSIVLAAISKALGSLGWEKGALALIPLLREVGKKETRQALEEVIRAIGAIGSPASIDPLIDLLRVLQTARRHPWPELQPLRAATKQALRHVTGTDQKHFLRWKEWWKKNKKDLLSDAKMAYWDTRSQQRIDLLPGDLRPKNAIRVGARLVDPPKPKPEKKKKKKKK